MYILIHYVSVFLLNPNPDQHYRYSSIPESSHLFLCSQYPYASHTYNSYSDFYHFWFIYFWFSYKWNHIVYTFFFFWPHSTAYAILGPCPGIKPVPSALEAQSLNYWTTREVPVIMVFFYICLYIGEGNSNPLQCSCLENSVDRGAWQAMVHGFQRVGHDRMTNTHTHILFTYLFIYFWLY